MVEHRSAWSATATTPPYEPLAADRQADVVVVGGGLIGLTTALYLAEAGADVVVLEARRVASGTTSGTTGKVTSQHGAKYADLLDRHGTTRAREYATANQAGVEEVAALVDRLGIDCEFLRTPAYVYSASSDGDLRREADVAASLGLPAGLVDPAELGLPIEIAEAVRFSDQVQLHPVQYLAGLAAAVTAAGGRIYEESRVTEVEGSVRTERGPAVQAEQVVFATLLPIGTTGGYFGRTRPVQSHGIALRLPVEAPAGMAISVDTPVRSTRPWPGGGPNGLIVVGGGHEVGADEDPEATYQSLVDWAGATWNFAAQPEYRWSAHDYRTPDLIPYVGKSPTDHSILVATGMNKWGLSNGTVAAGVLRDLILNRDNTWTELYDAGRVGDPQAVGKLIKDNLQVGKEFAAGHLKRLVKGGADHLGVGEGGLLETGDGKVGAYRDQNGELHEVSPVCTHLGCPLHWNSADTTWDCNCHGSRFDPTGQVLFGPATKPLERPE